VTFRLVEIHTAEPLVPEVELAIAKLKSRKSNSGRIEPSRK
jgi:hypothetical protein